MPPPGRMRQRNPVPERVRAGGSAAVRILFRYVLREFCIPLFYCTAGFLSIFVLFELFGSFGRIVDAGPAFGDVVRYFGGYIAPYFQWLMPASLLLATLYTMWNFCRHGELTAMRASGVGFAAIVRPILVASVLCACAVAWVNERFVPRHTKWAEDFREAKFREDARQGKDTIFAAVLPGTSRQWTAGRMLSPDASDLENVVISDKSLNMKVEARRARYLDGLWWIDSPKWSYTGPDGRPRPSPSPALDRLPFRALPECPETPRELLLSTQGQDFGKNSLNSLSTADRFKYIEMHPAVTPASRTKNTYDAWAKIAAPFACIVITLFAIPAGVATGRQSVFRGVLGAIGMFFAFFALSILCNAGCSMLADGGWTVPPAGAPGGFLRRATPAVAAFLPSAVFLAAGFKLFRRHR